MKLHRPSWLRSAAIGVFFLTTAAGADKSPPVVRVSQPDGQVFFGYYDLPVVDAAGRRHLAHRVASRERLPVAGDEAEIGWITVGGDGAFHPLGRTRAWNFQQGALLQWLGDGTGRVFYNDVGAGAAGYRGVLFDVQTGARRFTDRALANVSRDGCWGLAVDFDRMHDFRPGYGYAAQDDPRAAVAQPADDGVWVCDLRTGKSRLVLSLTALHERVRGLSPLMTQKLLVNHLTFNPSATRFVLLLRNFPAPGPRVKGQSAWQTAVFTAARDGSDLRLIVPPGYASHYYWRDDMTLVFHCDGPQGRQLYEITDAPPPRFVAIDPAFFTRDGHCSTSPAGRWMLYDSYPDAAKKQHLYIYDLQRRRGRDLGAFAALPVSVVDVRCDLHPRWLPDGRISFDSTHEGFRAVYVIDPRAWLEAWAREP